jgi:hypothetical protein
VETRDDFGLALLRPVDVPPDAAAVAAFATAAAVAFAPFDREDFCTPETFEEMEDLRG